VPLPFNRIRPPTCRRPGCAETALSPIGYCLHHDLRYHRWRAWRDELERDDLAATAADDPLDAHLAAALDELYEYLTPGPFTGQPQP
jgi:hypothetical protein